MGSNDNATWEEIVDVSLDITKASQLKIYDTSNNKYYKYIKLQFSSANLQTSSHRYNSLATLQFYGRELSVSVPTMTGNTEPWGEVSANGYFSTCYPYQAFADNGIWLYQGNGTNTAWITYDFKNPTIVKSLYSKNHADSSPRAVKMFDFKGWDGTSWVTIKSFTNPNSGAGGETRYTLEENNTAYNKYGIFVTDVYDTAFCGFSRLQFFGLDYSEHSERHYIYDNGVEVENVTLVGSATKESSQIKVSFSSGSGYAFLSKDLTSYNLMRVTSGDEIVQYQELYTITTPPTTSAFSEASRLRFNTGSNDLKNNCYLDLSSNTGSIYIGIGNKLTSQFIATVKSWWLE